MEAPTHKILAPLFTIGATTLYMRYMQPDISEVQTFSTLGISAISSYFSACWPDMDQHAKYKPLPVLWAGFSPITDACLAPLGVQKMSRVNPTTGKRLQPKYKYKRRVYTNIIDGNLNMLGLFKLKIPSPMKRLWATLFRLMGLREHREWQSHSPLIWVPIWYMLFTLAKSSGIAPTVFPYIVMGLGLGYISHLVGDLFTNNGIPFFPTFGGISEKIPVVNKFTDIRIARLGFCKASNKLWNKIVILIFADVALCLLVPDFGMQFNNFLLQGLCTGVLAIIDMFKMIFTT